MDRPKEVLLLAPCLDATDTGEAWSTYQWARGLAAHHRVTVLTYHKRDRPDPTDQLPEARMVVWKDLPGVHRLGALNNALKPGFVPFYFRARRWIKEALSRGRNFDLVHQVSPLALRYPCPATGLGLKTLLGPVAGSLPIPTTFLPEMGTQPAYRKLRGVDQLRLARDPWLRRSFMEAEGVIGVGPYVRDVLAGLPLRRFFIQSETGVLTLGRASDPPSGDPTLRLLHVGRLTRTKGLRDAIRALGSIRDRLDFHLDVLGKGEELAPCMEEARRLGVAERVTFHGQVPRETVEVFYRKADLFLFPSFAEPSGNVVFEALGNGLPVIAASTGGPGYVVNGTCGRTVVPESPDAFREGLAQVLLELGADPRLRERLSIGARERISEVALWPNKIRWMLERYEELTSESRNVSPVPT